MDKIVIIFGVVCVLLLVTLLYNLTQYRFNDDLAARNRLMNLLPAVFLFMVCGIIIFGGKLLDRKAERNRELQNLRDSIEYKDSIIGRLEMEIRDINKEQ